MLAESLSALAEALKVMAEVLLRNQDKQSATRDERRKAIGEVLKAVVATKAYVHDRTGAQSSRARERELALLWQDAATAVQRFDRNLYDSARMKAMGWADPAEWARVGKREGIVALDVVEAQCNWLLSQ